MELRNKKILVTSADHLDYIIKVSGMVCGEYHRCVMAKAVSEECAYIHFGFGFCDNKDNWSFSSKKIADDSGWYDCEEVFIPLPEIKGECGPTASFTHEEMHKLFSHPKADGICNSMASDSVKKPSHYQLLPEYEVKDVIEASLNSVESSEFNMSLYEAGWYQQSMQYFMRFHLKNGLEDLKKGVQTMQFVIDSMENDK